MGVDLAVDNLVCVSSSAAGFLAMLVACLRLSCVLDWVLKYCHLDVSDAQNFSFLARLDALRVAEVLPGE